MIKRDCFGTTEFSAGNSICRGCAAYDPCKDTKRKKKSVRKKIKKPNLTSIIRIQELSESI